jgi:hypothetical protein
MSPGAEKVEFSRRATSVTRKAEAPVLKLAANSEVSKKLSPTTPEF